MTPKELEHSIRSFLQQPMADAELREQLEKLAASEISFSGFTWLFGPELYRRNRILFRPFILSHFSIYMSLPKWRMEMIRWKGDKADVLEPWLAEVDKNDEADLFRRLYDWKLNSQFDWRHRDARGQKIIADLLSRFRSAGSPARRQIVLRKFDLWFQLDETSACALYSEDPLAAGPFILRRLPSGWSGGEPKRALWTKLLQLADQRKDEDFRWKLYRRQIPITDWINECLALCGRVQDPGELVSELERRHPEGWGINMADSFFQLVQRRGRDVFPYVTRHLRQIWGGWFTRGSYGKMADYARDKGWWDLWSALIRVCSQPNEFNKEVMVLLANHTTPESVVVDRLLLLAGVSKEWNMPGFGLAAVHQLEEPVAMQFYERFPDLLRGPYRVHVQPHTYGECYPELLDRLIAAGDEEMIDMMASRIVTRQSHRGQSKRLANVEKLAAYYTALKADEAVFSRRAGNVLGQVPAYSIYQYNQVVRENALARLLFERSASAYLADPRSLADLVEGSEIHVMSLAYRALGLDDDRAREQAAKHLPLLLGTLLRPMQRDTRTLAFGAIANAAGSLETARLVLDRAKDALNLPDKRYPKERLLGLIARLIHRWPELRGSREQPTVYERAA